MFAIGGGGRRKYCPHHAHIIRVLCNQKCRRESKERAKHALLSKRGYLTARLPLLCSPRECHAGCFQPVYAACIQVHAASSRCPNELVCALRGAGDVSTSAGCFPLSAWGLQHLRTCGLMQTGRNYSSTLDIVERPDNRVAEFRREIAFCILSNEEWGVDDVGKLVAIINSGLGKRKLSHTGALAACKARHRVAENFSPWHHRCPSCLQDGPPHCRAPALPWRCELAADRPEDLGHARSR